MGKTLILNFAVSTTIIFFLRHQYILVVKAQSKVNKSSFKFNLVLDIAQVSNLSVFFCIIIAIQTDLLSKVKQNIVFFPFPFLYNIFLILQPLFFYSPFISVQLPHIISYYIKLHSAIFMPVTASQPNQPFQDLSCSESKWQVCQKILLSSSVKTLCFFLNPDISAPQSPQFLKFIFQVVFFLKLFSDAMLQEDKVGCWHCFRVQKEQLKESHRDKA